MKKKLTKIFLFTSFTLLTVAPAFAKTSHVKILEKDFVTTVVGKFNKHDSDFAYLSVKGAQKDIKIPKKYLLNHPALYSRGMNLKVELPLSVFFANNLVKDTNSKKN